MLVQRRQRLGAAATLATTLAPALAPVVRRGAEELYAYVTRPPSTKGALQTIIRDSHEPKNVDVFAADTLSTTAAAYTLILLNAIDQGTGGSERTGRQVMLDHLDLRINFLTATTAAQGDNVRVIIVWDKECRGASFVHTDLLALNGSTVAQSVSPFNFDNVPTRLKVLYDRRVPLNPSSNLTAATGLPYQTAVDVTLKLNKRVHFYNTTGGGIADIDSGALQVFIVGAVNTNPSSLTLASRLVYRDL